VVSIKDLTNVSDSRSLANRMRNRRFARFEALTTALPRPLRIIDIGGTSSFWEQRGWAGRSDVQITLVNLAQDARAGSNLTAVVGDATNLSAYPDASFDVAFSNSVIEHLFTRENQAAMAREIRRVAPAFWLQTPNYWFPLEPHFHIVGWQWLPEPVRVGLLRRRRCGWRGPCADDSEALRCVREVQLLTRRDLKELFPGATITPEHLFGLVKSWIVTGGFATNRPT
jgi:hypothetical protein